MAPESTAVNHAYGLHLVRLRQYENAIPYLTQAAVLEGSSPRYAYVLAVALDHLGRTAESLSVLSSANDQWPMQYELLMTMVQYLEKTKQTGFVPQYLHQLKQLAPDSPDVKMMLRRYGMQ